MSYPEQWAALRDRFIQDASPILACCDLAEPGLAMQLARELQADLLANVDALIASVALTAPAAFLPGPVDPPPPHVPPAGLSWDLTERPVPPQVTLAPGQPSPQCALLREAFLSSQEEVHSQFRWHVSGFFRDECCLVDSYQGRGTFRPRLQDDRQAVLWLNVLYNMYVDASFLIRGGRERLVPAKGCFGRGRSARARSIGCGYCVDDPDNPSEHWKVCINPLHYSRVPEPAWQPADSMVTDGAQAAPSTSHRSAITTRATRGRPNPVRAAEVAVEQEESVQEKAAVEVSATPPTANAAAAPAAVPGNLRVKENYEDGMEVPCGAGIVKRFTIENIWRKRCPIDVHAKDVTANLIYKGTFGDSEWVEVRIPIRVPCSPGAFRREVQLLLRGAVFGPRLWINLTAINPVKQQQAATPARVAAAGDADP